MQSRKENNSKNHFSENVEVLYIFSSSAILLGFIADIITYFDNFDPFVLIVTFSILISIIILFILGLLGKLEISKSFLGMVYLTFLGLFIVYIYDIMTEILLTHLLIRNFIIFPIVLFSIGFIVNKKQMLITGIIVATAFSIIMISSQIEELIEITPFFIIMILISIFTMQLFLSVMEKSINENSVASAELLEQKNRLELLNKDKNNLFAVISHDLRGPVGNARQMIRYLIDNETTEEEKEFLIGAINSSIGNSYNLLSNLLLWANNERGIIEFDKKNIDISKSIADTINLLQKSAEEKNIIIENRFKNSLLSYSDKNLFETIIRNLLANAIKFTNDKGKIIVSYIMSGNTITISVKDNGIGISKERQKKIFSDFSIAPSYGTKNEKGSGLGLKLCKEFTNKNGGKIWVTSEVGKGSEFSFTVPKERIKIHDELFPVQINLVVFCLFKSWHS